MYREGLSWLDGIPSDGRFEAAKTYMQQGLYAEKLIHTIETSNLPDREKIADILRMSATRDLTILALDKKGNEATAK